MKKHIIKEQLQTDDVTTQKNTLTNAKNIGCIPKMTEEMWYTLDKIKKTTPNFPLTSPIYWGGMNEKGSLLFWSSDMKVHNWNTKATATWQCPGLEVSVDKTTPRENITADQMVAIDRFVKDNPKYVKENPGEEKVGPGKEFQKIDANDVLPKDFPTKGVYSIYQRTGIVGTTQDYVTKFQPLLKNAGYTFNEPEVGQEYLLNTKRKATQILGDRYSTEFGKTIPFVYMTIDKWNELSALDRRTCRDSIKTLNDSFKEPGRSNMLLGDRINLKNKVWFCSNKRFGRGIFGVGDEMDTILKARPTPSNPFGMGGYNPTDPRLSESRENSLKKLLRENLISIKEEKKKNLLQESEIVKNRILFLTENVSIDTKKGKDNFCNDLLNEMIYLNSQGFDKQVISEGLFDIFSSLFGNAGEGIKQYFKEYIATWLIGKLGIDSEGWIGGLIVRTFGNLPIGDIPKLTDCNFTTKLLSKSLAEEAIEQLKSKAGLEGAFYDILRNSVVESLEDSELGQKIEGALGSLLCPLLGQVSNKMSDTADKMKQGALSLS